MFASLGSESACYAGYLSLSILAKANSYMHSTLGNKETAYRTRISNASGVAVLINTGSLNVGFIQVEVLSLFDLTR